MPAPAEAAVARVVQRILPAADAVAVARMRDGGSTWVYRVMAADATYFLRVLPETGASCVPEALAHGAALARGVAVPAVLHVEPYNRALDRSIMLTSAIAGGSLRSGAPPATAAAILRAAGRALALLNGIPVRGWGWIRRDAAAADALLGEHATWHAWRDQYRRADLAALQSADVLSAAEADLVAAAIRRWSRLLDGAPAGLAHGDFDPTHIYHADGRFSGIIDFGEIRGAHPLYDLGHFNIENATLLPGLLAGYLDGAPPTAALLQRIHVLTLLIALRRLARHVERGRNWLYAPDRAAIMRSVAALT